MKPKIETCLSPALLPNYKLNGKTVVVIDVFRATSTICAILGNGAISVIPVGSVDKCKELGSNENTITAGERGGKVIPGLERGNSPVEFTSDVVKNKTVALTTTNGTRLMQMVGEASQILIGSFLNLQAICDYLILSGRDVVLACSGWQDLVNLEDTLFAGAVVHYLHSKFDVLDDNSILAEMLYKQSQNFNSLREFLQSATHYQRLLGFGLEKDLEYCCRMDIHPVVPFLQDGVIQVYPLDV